MLGRGGEHENERIKKRLREGEEILLTVTQAKAVKPSTYFVTTERVIIREVGVLGETLTSLKWTDVNDFVLGKHLLRSEIAFEMGGGRSQTLSDIRKSDAEKMYELIESYVRKGREGTKTKQSTVGTNPLDILKTKLVSGEISEEEYERKKKLLE